MELELRQEQQLSMRQLHSLRLLQMGRLEIREYLETVAQENPTVELELPHEEEPLTRQAERWLDRWRWLEENDRQNSYYERPNQEEEDSPMNRIGTDGGLAETLESFLCRQIAGLFNSRPGSNADVYAHLSGDDTRQGGLAQTRRAVKQHMVQRLRAAAGSLNKNREVFLGLALSDILL